LYTDLRLGLPSGLFPSGFPTNILYAFFVSPIRATCPANLWHYRPSDKYSILLFSVLMAVIWLGPRIQCKPLHTMGWSVK
jgi:hypothetical protein